MNFSPHETSKRRVRRALPRADRSQPMVGLINAAILTVGLTVILASRCESGPKNSGQSENWLNSFVTPKDLHLPESVTDRLIKRKALQADHDLIESEGVRSFEESF